MKSFLKRVCSPVLLSLLVSGCSLFGSDDEVYYIPEPELYEQAMEAVKDGRYSQAAEDLETLETHYPFGRYSEQAQLELIYVYYQLNNVEQGLASCDRFLRLYPDHENIDYVYYLRGLINFDADKNFIDRFVPTDPSRRDPGAARDSFGDFATLIEQFPQSEYAPDAQKRMLYLKNQLAQYEIHVANYYIRRGAWVAAANRGRYVVENYQQTPAVPFGLDIMVRAYAELGLTDAATHAQEVLDTNFPGFNAQEDVTDWNDWLETLTFGWISNDDQEGTPAPAAD